MKNRQVVYKISFILLLIDQIIKILVNHNMKLYEEIKVVKNFFSLTYLKNTGAAFSILENFTVFLVILSAIFILIIDKYIKKEESKLKKLDIYSYGLIMGGIFGNLIDRIIHHGVIDYLSFEILKYNFPVFNFADICITVGVFLIIINVIFAKKS